MAEIKTINYIPLADTTARENITTINENITTINENISQLSDEIANLSGGTYSSIEPKYDDIPKVFFDEAIPQTKDDVVTKFRYISKTQDISGYAEFKAQGNSSMNYPKKNVTVKMYQDEALETKLKIDFKNWGKQSKHVYKANWIDLTHARNIVSARIWSDVVKSRSEYENYPSEFKASPNQGAIDGFPVKVYSQGIYQGRYTLNIPKDAWTFNMDKDLDNHCILCGENYASGCFRASASINESDWTDEVHDTVPTSIKTRWNEVISFVMNSSDDEFKTNLSNYFYVDSLIDYFIYGMVSCGLDAFGKNQIYVTYDGQKWIASMYDMDSTWGLYYTGSKFVSSSYSRNEYEDFVNGRQGNLLYIRLAQLFVDEIKARHEVLKKGVLSIPNIINHFERFTDIAPLDLVKEDYASTTGSGEFTGIPSKDTNNIQQIRKYVVDRYSFVDGYIASLTDSGGEDIPTEAPLTSIEATYSGGEVLVGTDVDDLTGITVTGTYSDGTTKNIIDYTLSGEIVEGSNTITVSYEGKTTTFTVVGEVPTDYVYSLPQAMTFDGTNYYDTGYKLLNEDKDFTLLCEFQPSTTSQTHYNVVLQCAREESPFPGLALRVENSTYVYFLDAKSIAFSNLTVQKTIVIVSHTKGTNGVTCICLNGYSKRQLDSADNFPQIEETLLLGANVTLDGTYRRFWNGNIHDLKVFERILTDEEIYSLIDFQKSYIQPTWSETPTYAYDLSTGTKGDGKNYVTTQPIEVQGGSRISFKRKNNSTYTYLAIFEYDSNMNFIRYNGNFVDSIKYIAIVSESTKYIHLTAYPNNTSTDNNPSEQLLVGVETSG